MTSITAQQTKLDLELVPKENRLDIRKCNGRIPHGLKPKKETFQVVLDALTLTPCLPKAPNLNQNLLESPFMRRNQSSRTEFASRQNWFIKPSRPQEPTDPDWNEDKTPQKGPTQNWLMTLASIGKSLKEFDELMSTLIDFSSYILNGLKIKNITQEILLGLAFRLLKGTRSSYAEIGYDFEECYKALSEKLDWENPEGGDYPFDLSKPIPLIMHGNHQSVPVEFFINNDLKYLKGGVSTITYTTSTTKTNPLSISHWRDQRKTFYTYARGIQSRGDVYFTKRILAVTQVLLMRKHRYRYLEEIVVSRADNKSYKFKEDQRHQPDTTRPDLRKRYPYTPYKNPQGFIYVDDYQRNRLMCSDKLYKFNDGTLTLLLYSLEGITKNINMKYLPKRRWSTLEKKRAHFMIKDINKLLKERRMM
nr:hypothetical protein [Tanacetum cinerariifolium]